MNLVFQVFHDQDTKQHKVSVNMILNVWSGCSVYVHFLCSCLLMYFANREKLQIIMISYLLKHISDFKTYF